jgi:hypothetical protein
MIVLLGLLAKARNMMGGNERYQLRDGSAPYMAPFRVENGDIGLENDYFRGVNNE